MIKSYDYTAKDSGYKGIRKTMEEIYGLPDKETIDTELT